MSRKYLYVHDKKKSREYSKIATVINTGADKVKREADWITYHVGIEDESLGRPRKFADAKDRANELRKQAPIGKNVRIATKAKGDGPVLDVVVFSEIEDDPKVYNGPGVEGIDRFEAFVKQHFPRARFAGDCVCKPDSDHRDCAAVDYFDTYTNMDKMRNEALSNSGYYHTKYVILRDRIYFPGQGSHYYSGVYHTHIHVSVWGGRPGSAC